MIFHEECSNPGFYLALALAVTGCSSKSSGDPGIGAGGADGGLSNGGSGNVTVADLCKPLQLGGSRGVTELYAVASPASIDGLVLQNGYLYFESTSGLMRISVTEDAAELIATYATGNHANGGPLAITATTAVWAESSSSSLTNPVRIFSKPLATPQATAIAVGQGMSLYGLVANDTSVFWAGFGTDISTAPIAGGATTTIGSNIDAQGLLMIGSDLYWGNGALGTPKYELMRVPTAGGTPQSVASTGMVGAEQLATDGDTIYYTASPNFALWVSAWPLNATEPKTIYSAPGTMSAAQGGGLIAAYGGTAYFTQSTPCSDAAGDYAHSVWQANKDGTGKVLAVSGLDVTQGIAVDSSSVYVATYSYEHGGHIYRFSR